MAEFCKTQVSSQVDCRDLPQQEIASSYTTQPQSEASYTYIGNKQVARSASLLKTPNYSKISLPTMLNSAAADPNDASHLSKLLATVSMAAIASPPGRYCRRLLNELLFSNETDQLAQLIQKILGESPARAKEISADWLLHRQISQRCWQSMANSSFKRIRRNALDSFFPHERQVVRYMQNCDRGVLITSIHMGDYLHGLLHLCLSVSCQKEVFILRNRNWDQLEERAFEKFSAAGVRVTVLRRQRSVALSAVKQLKRGNIVVALYDLSKQWGSTTRVTFFNRKMALVRGPAELAILAQADILPIMFHYASDGCRVIDCFPVVRPPARAKASLDAAVKQITQTLIKQAERQIRRFPGQWHHWHLLPAMLADE